MIQLDDLNDHCLLMILDQLPPNQLFKVLRINRRLNRLAAEKMRNNVKAVVLKRWEGSHVSVCTHLSSIRPNDVLNLGPKTINWLEDGEGLEKNPSKKALLLGVFSKCPNIKCLFTNYFRLPGDVFIEVTKRCCKIECIRFGVTILSDDEWRLALDQIGHKIIHMTKNMFDWIEWVPDDENELVDEEVPILKIIAEKCPNIKQVDWKMFLNMDLTRDLLTSLKLLPKSSRISLRCSNICEITAFDDIFDKLNVQFLEWSLICNRPLNRLSSLKFSALRPFLNDDDHDDGPVIPINFAGLKKLDSRDSRGRRTFNRLLASRFPLIKVFGFNATGLNQDDFNSLFQRIRSVKKLTLLYTPYYMYAIILLPSSSAIYQLMNLESLELVIELLPNDWQPDDFLKQVEQCLDENTSSLKKLIVDMNLSNHCLISVVDCQILGQIEEEFRRLKARQNQVEINWILRRNLRNY